MLLGKAVIEGAELKAHISSLEDFYGYCDSLVPEEFRHLKQIRDNQRYLCAMVLRKSNLVPWDKKKDLLVSIMSETRVIGLTDVCIDISQLYEYISRKRMEKYKRRFG